MRIGIYQNKKIKWKWALLETGRFERHFFFYQSIHKYSKIIMINITPFYFVRNNCETKIGLSFLKWHIGFLFHR